MLLHLPALLALTICASAVGALALGGPAYVDDNGAIAYTSSLQSSGSDDDLVFVVAAISFAAYLLLTGWLPRRLFYLKAGAFLGAWLLQLPNCGMEVGSYRATLLSAHNAAAAAFVLVFLTAPIGVLFAINHVRAHAI